MIKKKEADHKFHANLQKGTKVLEKVMCEVYLPVKLSDPIEFHFRPSKVEMAQIVGFFEFSLRGEIKNYSGKTSILFQADKVYSKGGSTKHWGSEISESIVVGEPTDLKIIDLLDRDKPNAKNGISTKGCFWLTPSIMLSPSKMIMNSYTGEVSVDTVHKFEFALESGLQLSFDGYFRYSEDADGDTITFQELVAEFEIEEDKQDPNIVLGYLDDFLMLTSFAARQRCICLGWEKADSVSYTKFFRRNLAIPTKNKNHSHNETLIDIQDFEDFINIVYKRFIEIEPKDLIRQAIQGTIYRENVLNSNFMRLYSTLETLVLLFRRKNQLETVLPLNQWERFHEELKDFIRQHPEFAEDKDRRKLVYEKLMELNRVSFPIAFRKFCQQYSIDLHDLWPIIDGNEGVSLSDIRHKLVHGDTFSPPQERALIIASLHLQWTVERSLLSVLGWPIGKSKVTKEFLSRYMTGGRNWENDRCILSKS